MVLHLWNDRRGKVLRIGSIMLLAGASRRKSWSRRLSELFLLLLRCLLLVAMAAVLAGPYWRRAADARKGWVLEAGAAEMRAVEAGLGAADAAEMRAAEAGGLRAAYGPLIDSLLKAGYERHVLEDSVNYWEGFSAADRAAAKGIPFYIFTPGWAERYSGERPRTDREIHWNTYTPADSVRHWIQRAWVSGPDSIRVLLGSSRSTGTVYREVSEAVPARDDMEDGFRILRQGGRLAVAMDSELTMEADTSILRITIYTEPVFRQDGRYVAAAVRALQRYTHRRIDVQVTGRVPVAAVSGSGWLFWLAASPMPAGLGFNRLFCYEPGKEILVNSRFEGIELMKEVETAADPVEGMRARLKPVWQDGYGRAVLSMEDSAAIQRYHFFSRFDPDWSGLVWSRSFPVLIARLLFGADTSLRAMTADRRMLDPEQVIPAKVAAGRDYPGPEVLRQEDLGRAIWLVIVLLFILERAVSYSIIPLRAND